MAFMDTIHIEALKTFVDGKGLLLPADGVEVYQVGARRDTGIAACVLRPTNTQEVSNIVAYCVKQGIHIIPQSGNTGLVGGSIPDDTGAQVILNFERMNSIIDIDPVNQSAHTGAGLRLSALNSACENHNQYLPIDLGSDPCLGGMVSTNTGGSRYLKYRGMREHVMGVKAVLADDHGTIIDVLTPLHKNNTGFDVKQLFIGSGGIFGFVTEVIVRLAPKPQQSAAALLIPSSIEAINMLLHEIELRCGTYLSALEGMSGNAIKCAFAHNPSLPSPFGQDDIPDYAILVELSRTWQPRGGEQSLDEVLENVLAEIWEHDDAPLDNALLGAPEKLWHLRHSLSEGVQRSGKLYAFDVSFKRSDVISFHTYISAQLAEHYPEITLCDFGHIGDGAIHCSLVLDKDDPRGADAAFEAEFREWVNDIVVHKFGGSYSAEHGLGRKTQDAYNKYTSEEVKNLTRAIKAAIAPRPIGTIEV